jgi:hypothetical protein
VEPEREPTARRVDANELSGSSHDFQSDIPHEIDGLQ